MAFICLRIADRISDSEANAITIESVNEKIQSGLLGWIELVSGIQFCYLKITYLFTTLAQRSKVRDIKDIKK